MAEFESQHDFHYFAQFVKQTSRYVLDGKQQHFLDVLIETSGKRRTRLLKDSVVHRAQLGRDIRTRYEPIEGIEDQSINGLQFLDERQPHRPQRMMPRTSLASEGRVNPKGIPCLYLSSEPETAMTEVRPWIGSYVSVAKVTIVRDLALVDCVSDTRVPTIYPIGSLGPTRDEKEKDVWWFVSQEFSKPVIRADDVADYAPTQLLAEAFRKGGFDGIQYSSKLGSGMNYAVFDLTAADLTSCDLYQLEAFNPKFLKVNGSYKAIKK